MRKSILLFFLVLFQSVAVNAQWAQTNGPHLGYINAVVAGGNYLWAGTNDGLYLSENNGVSWSFAGLDNYEVLSLLIKDSNLYAGTRNGIFRSPDSAVTWTAVNNGLTSNVVSSLVIMDTCILAGTMGGGVFLTADNGGNWVQMNNGLSSNSVHSILVVDTNIFLSTHLGGVFKSTDRCATWTQKNVGLVNKDISAIAYNGVTLFAATAAGIYKSTNLATNWGSPTYTGNAFTSVTVNAGILYVGQVTSGVLSSANGGASWSSCNQGLSSKDIHLLYTVGTDTYAGTGKGLFRRTSNAGSWASRGITSPDIIEMTSLGQKVFACTYGYGLYSTVDQGASWVVSPGLTPLYLTALTAHGSRLIVGATLTNGGVYWSADNGTTWTASAITSGVVHDLATDGVNLLCGTEGGLYISYDQGSTWTETSISMDAVYISEISGSNVFVEMGTNGDLYYSNNYGNAPWSVVSGNGLPSGYAVEALLMVGNDLLAATAGGLYRSSNYGSTWSPSGLAGISMLNIANVGGYLFAATFQGVFVSQDMGHNWFDVNDGFGNVVATCFAAAGDTLYAGTAGSGVWSRSISQMMLTVSDQRSMAEHSFRIFPNPATDRLNIEYDGSEKLFSVSVYNMQGVLILRQSLLEGATVLDWSDFPAGVYLVRTDDGRVTETKKVIKE